MLRTWRRAQRKWNALLCDKVERCLPEYLFESFLAPHCDLPIPSSAPHYANDADISLRLTMRSIESGCSRSDDEHSKHQKILVEQQKIFNSSVYMRQPFWRSTIHRWSKSSQMFRQKEHTDFLATFPFRSGQAHVMLEVSGESTAAFQCPGLTLRQPWPHNIFIF